MNSLTSSDEDTINQTLAKCLGFKAHEVIKDLEHHTIWDAPLGLTYYSLFPPQFTRGWKWMKLLVRGMELSGYSGFELRRFSKRHWIAGFTCSLGPCLRHGTNTNDWHGSRAVPGENPGQATAFAAISALASGKFAVREYESPHQNQTTKFDFDWKPILTIISEHVQRLEDRTVIDCE